MTQHSAPHARADTPIGSKMLAAIRRLSPDKKATRKILDRMIFFGEQPFRRALRNFVEHYHLERNHQGVGNELLVAGEETLDGGGTIRRRERLGGLLNFYHRQAA